MTAPPDIVFLALEDQLRCLASSARSELRLVAPFIKTPQLATILRAVASDVRISVTTRWRPEEVAAGISDLDVFDLCRDRGAELMLHDGLHAKVYLADGERMLVGSSNLTARGLGVAQAPNFEVLLPCTPSRRSTVLMLAAMDARSRCATERERALVAGRAAEIAAAPSPSFDPLPAAVEPVWLPSFRSPDRLHAVYIDLSETGSCEEDRDALVDLAMLGIPFGLDRKAFDQKVRRHLRASSAVAALDRYLSRPRRFGEVSRWLLKLRPGAHGPDRARAAQTVIRWLLHFDPHRYRIDVPNHSEIFSLRPGGPRGV